MVVLAHGDIVWRYIWYVQCRHMSTVKDSVIMIYQLELQDLKVYWITKIIFIESVMEAQQLISLLSLIGDNNILLGL